MIPPLRSRVRNAAAAGAAAIAICTAGYWFLGGPEATGMHSLHLAVAALTGQGPGPAGLGAARPDSALWTFHLVAMIGGLALRVYLFARVTALVVVREVAEMTRPPARAPRREPIPFSEAVWRN